MFIEVNTKLCVCVRVCVKVSKGHETNIGKRYGEGSEVQTVVAYDLPIEAIQSCAG